MNEKRQIVILTLFIAAFFALLTVAERQASGAELNDDVGTSHSALGAIGLDARAAALGQSVTAVDLGVTGLEYNPAVTALIDGRRLYLGHLNWVLDTNLSQTLVAFPFRDEGVITLGLVHFDQGTVDEVLEDGTYTGERLGARDMQFGVGYARDLGSVLSFGARLAVLYKSLGRERTGGVLGSVGLISPEMDGFRIGAAVQDIGPGIRFRELSDPAPMRYRIGVSHQVRIGEGKFRLQNSLDYVIPRDNHASFGFGTEWDYRDILILRAGYRRTLMEDETPDGDRFRYGCGLRVGNYRFDYTYAPKEDFEPVHRVAVTFEFREAADKLESESIARQIIARAMAYDSLMAARQDTLQEDKFKPLSKVTVLQGITFTLNSSEIHEASFSILNEIFARLVSTPNVEAVEIQGHTDNTGSVEFNRQLSLDRAKAVREYFVRLGYPARRIGSMGFGAERPLVSNDTVEGRAANRRIEIHLVRSIEGG